MTEWNDFITSLKLSLRNMYMYYKIKKNMKYTLHLASFRYSIKFKDFILWSIKNSFTWWYVLVAPSLLVSLAI